MSTQDYDAAASDVSPPATFAGPVPATPWEPALQEDLQRRRVAIYEEQLRDRLFGDMRREGRPTSRHPARRFSLCAGHHLGTEGFAMPISRLNHAVLYVRDVSRSVAFYTEVLGFRAVPVADGMPGAAFLQAPGSTNDHDLGLFEVGSSAGASSAGRATVGLYHLAWEVDTLAELERLAGALAERDALTGASDHGTAKSLYGRDPDGLEFEVAWVVPADRLDDATLALRASVRPLDLEYEKQRYGATTAGGVGVSTPGRP